MPLGRERKDIMISRSTLFKVFCFTMLGAMLWQGCHRDTEQDKVKKVIEEVQKSAEEKDIRTILSHLSKTYADPQGNDYAGIKDLLLVYFFRYPKVSVFITDMEISVDGVTASAKFQAVLAGRKSEEAVRDILPEALGVYGFAVKFSPENGEWKISSAKWDRKGDGS